MRAHADRRELLGERVGRRPRPRVDAQLGKALAAGEAGLREQLARALDVVGRPAPSAWPGMTGGTAPPRPAARSTPGELATSDELSIAWAIARRTRSSAISSDRC